MPKRKVASVPVYPYLVALYYVSHPAWVKRLRALHVVVGRLIGRLEKRTERRTWVT
jgi:hypothetical protein